MTAKISETSIVEEAKSILDGIGVSASDYSGGAIDAISPITGARIGGVKETSAEDAEAVIRKAHQAFLTWRDVPPPKRGELVRIFGNELRKHKKALGRLISIEVGKIESEGLGEVQEMIDICDFAVGLSRQLYGLTIATEREHHRMMEIWHPLGVTGIITAFNFPTAVWSWNAALALVCGNSVVWKPSEKAPLTALATQTVFESACEKYADAGYGAPEGLSAILMGRADIGEVLVDHPHVRLVSATGSTAMGRAVGPRAAKRFARVLLELGGNNATIICPSANLDLALRGVAFAAMGTVGQRCTTLRRAFIHESIYDDFVPRLKAAYSSAKVGSPLDKDTLIGPLIDKDAYQDMQQALTIARGEGGDIIGGGRVPFNGADDAYYVSPALVEMPAQTNIVKEETFAPILYVMRYADLDKALKLHNEVGQGLSSSMFTTDLREMETFVSAHGSDCGIANINIGPSGAEIGGAFGGEKETGGGRESGSDAWKAYMRRQTNTINYGASLPLAQGVTFDV